METVGKIGLGTVQWGMPYGVANRAGRPDDAEISRMVELAAAAGISVLDTAHAYGDAEAVIGRISAAAPARIITKTIPIKADAITAAHIAEVDAAFRRSLERLRREHVDSLLVHAAQNLLCPGGEKLWDWLEQVRASGRTRRIGVSLYDPEQYISLRERHTPDVVQIPFNIYDRRFARSGALRDMAANNVEVHVRSAFLQGLLLLPPDGLPDFCTRIRPHHARLMTWIAGAGLTPLAACLGFSAQAAHVDRVIVGCETAAQLQGIIEAAAQAARGVNVPEEFALEDESILNPARWPPSR